MVHNDEELEAYTAALFQLTALEKPSGPETEAIELLTLLVERYEQQHYPVPAADPVSVVRFLMEQQGLKQRDLVPQFGSESAVSMFLAGQRKPTLEQVRKLRAGLSSCGCLHHREVMGQPLARPGCVRPPRAIIKLS